eukprot:5796329-Prymnesium_polylepis.1
MLLALLAAVSLAPDEQASYSYVRASQALRKKLLADYDRKTAPFSRRRPGHSALGTDVAMQIRFFKTEEVDVAKGSMRLKVWLRFEWNDMRLSWNPREENVTQLILDQSEPWLPDITHFNAKAGINSKQEGFEEADLKLRFNGDLFWSRQGILIVLCKFSGLAQVARGWTLSGASTPARGAATGRTFVRHRVWGLGAERPDPRHHAAR